jgi:hypothetical protein
MIQHLPTGEIAMLTEPAIPAQQRTTNAPPPAPQPPDWATPAVAAELRSIVAQIKTDGAAVVSHDETAGKHRKMFEELLTLIGVLEHPKKLPTPETALELARAKFLEIQMTAFIGFENSRRPGLLDKVWAGVKSLSARLTKLTGRGEWIFNNHENKGPERAWILCEKEVERVLRGEPDGYDLMNPDSGPVNLFTSNTISNQSFNG